MTEKSTWRTESWRRLEKRVGKNRRLDASCCVVMRLNCVGSGRQKCEDPAGQAGWVEVTDY